jgi:hypothetical protein
VVEDVHLDRDWAEDLVLLPAVGEDPLLDDVLDDEFGLREGGHRQQWQAGGTQTRA